MTKDRLVDILHEIRKKRVCGYADWMCDCKFGAKSINSAYTHNEPYSMGEDNGCPELWLAADIINEMTEDEFKEIYNRVGMITL